MFRLFFAAALALISSASFAGQKFEAALAQSVVTRLGELAVDRDHDKNVSTLTLDEKKIFEHKEGPMFMSPLIVGAGKEFVLLFRSTGGIACAGDFIVLELKKPLLFSAPFGNCSDSFRAGVEGDTLVISMPGYVPHPELLSKAARAKASKSFDVYMWVNGKLAEKKSSK